MTDEVQTTRYRNLENYPVHLPGVNDDDSDIPEVNVAAYGFADLSEEQVKANRSTIDEHLVKVLEPDKEDTPSFDRKAALEKARELGISGTSQMRNDVLQTAIINAERERGES